MQMVKNTMAVQLCAILLAGVVFQEKFLYNVSMLFHWHSNKKILSQLRLALKHLGRSPQWPEWSDWLASLASIHRQSYLYGFDPYK